jgi:hypothetical protein
MASGNVATRQLRERHQFVGVASRAWHHAENRVVHAPAHPAGNAESVHRKIVGDFEVDESFIGGSARFMHKDKKAKITGTGGTGGGKAVVMGLLDRKSKKVRLRHVRDTSGPTLQGVVREYVQGGSYVYSDAWRSYNGLSPFTCIR